MFDSSVAADVAAFPESTAIDTGSEAADVRVIWVSSLAAAAELALDSCKSCTLEELAEADGSSSMRDTAGSLSSPSRAADDCSDACAVCSSSICWCWC